MELTDGSRIAVIGGGPAGAFVSYFLLEMASRIDLKIRVDIYEAIFVRTLRPSFLFRLTQNVAATLFLRGRVFSREVSS